MDDEMFGGPSMTTTEASVGAETVYGTQDDQTIVMSEKVQSLAGSIYQEFERMIQRYDEDVVKSLMPLLVNVLECLDAAYQTNQEQDVEVELLREDNEQLVTQYEREKAARKQAEQKLLDTEDLAEIENKELENRLETLESIVRMLELKHKNSLEHALRLEEREAELKKEYSKLHDRYTDLLKTHMEYMERTKLMISSTHSHLTSASDRVDINKSRIHPTYRSSGPISCGFASLESSQVLDIETISSPCNSSDGSAPTSLQNEFDAVQTVERSAETDALIQSNQATSPSSMMPSFSLRTGHTTTKNEKRSANTLYQELSFQDNEESEDAEVTGSWVHPGDYASTGMGKEVENLILENNELLATKNALNIVKDDLIVKVDELTGELEILREELVAVSQSRQKLRQSVCDLEEELKKTKLLVKQQGNIEQEDEVDIPMAERKRFTRLEMARVLMERNQYKERFMELQEAVRWTEMIRVSRIDMNQKTKDSIWKKFFSKFSLTSSSPHKDHSGRLYHNNTGLEGRVAIANNGINNYRHNSGSTSSNTLVIAKDYVDDYTLDRGIQKRREQYKQVRAHVSKEDGRLQAYGWSLPGTKTNPIGPQKSDRKLPKVPVPVFCSPLAGASPHIKVFCAAGVNLNGGYTRDGVCIVPNAYPSNSSAHITEVPPNSTCADGNNEIYTVDSIDRHFIITMEMSDPDLQLSSLVWVCSGTHSSSTITVIDAKNPAVVLDSFPISQTHLLSICSVQGTLEKDYVLLENSEVIKSGETLEKPGEGFDEIGKVEFIALRGKNVSHTSFNIKHNNSSETVVNSSQLINVSNYCHNIGEDVETLSCDKISSTFVESLDSAVDADKDEVTDSSNADNNNCVSYEINPVNPILNSTNPSEEQHVSSVGPTMWLGAQNGMLYVHSAISHWRECLHKVCLPDAVLCILHIETHVVAALANGKIAVFRRKIDGYWDLHHYHLVTLGLPKHSVRCLCKVGDKIWASHRNKIFVVDPFTLNIVHSFEAHPRKESEIRQMTSTGLGVWVSIRLDSTLRLYHACTFEHLQDVDIEPYVSKMLGTGKLGFCFARITALVLSCNRLWIGTGNGVIISIPISDDTTNNKDGAPKFIPRCCMANAQLSFHGHREAVKFFVSVPKQCRFENFVHMRGSPIMLVISGGEGYIDFRHGSGDMENSIVLEPNQTIENRGDESYLIVWHVNPV